MLIVGRGQTLASNKMRHIRPCQHVKRFDITGRNLRLAENYMGKEFLRCMSPPPATIGYGRDRIARSRRRLCTLLITMATWFTMVAAGEALEAVHDLSVTLIPSAGRLSGVDLIVLNSCTPGRVSIGLNPRIRVKSLRVNGTSRTPLFTPRGPALTLTEAECETPVELTVRYEGDFQDDAPVQPVNTDNPGYGVSGTISPRGTLLLGGAGWYPAIGDALETVRLKVKAPAGISAVTAGRSVGIESEDGQTVSIWQIDAPAGRLALSAGPYVLTSSHAGTVPISTYFLSDDRHLADTYLKATKGYLSLYENMFGPYAFPKFAVVENFFPTGYGFPSYTLIGGRVLRLPFIVRTSLGHEIAHCWWGNGVHTDPSDGNWSEGLTSYVAEHLYQERISPQAARDYRRQLLRSYANLVPPEDDFPLRRFTHRYSPLTAAIGYDKGAMVFHMLRQTIGERAFQDGLRRLYATYLHRSAGWNDLQTTFESTWGGDLTFFFQQWVDRSGAPTLWLEGIQTEAVSADTYRVQGILRQKAPYYRLEVPLALSSDVSEATARVAIDDQAVPFQLTVRGKPHRLEADPHTDVFRRLSEEEIPATINALKRPAPLVVVVASEAVSDADRQTAQTLARALGRSELVLQPAENFDIGAAGDTDVVFLGSTAHSSIRELMQDAVVLQPGEFVVKGKTFDARHASFFGVWRHPRSRDRVIAFLSRGPEAYQPTIARKIPHYGRYSYLVFEDDTNRMKGIWPAASSPLIHVWPADKGGHNGRTN